MNPAAGTILIGALLTLVGLLVFNALFCPVEGSLEIFFWWACSG